MHVMSMPAMVGMPCLHRFWLLIASLLVAIKACHAPLIVIFARLSLGRTPFETWVNMPSVYSSSILSSRPCCSSKALWNMFLQLEADIQTAFLWTMPFALKSTIRSSRARQISAVSKFRPLALFRSMSTATPTETASAMRIGWITQSAGAKSFSSDLQERISDPKHALLLLLHECCFLSLQSLSFSTVVDSP